LRSWTGRVPQAKSSGRKSSVAVTAECRPTLPPLPEGGARIPSKFSEFAGLTSCCYRHYTSQMHIASCLIYSYALIEYINRFAVDRMVTFYFMMLPSVKFAEEKMLVFFILREKC